MATMEGKKRLPLWVSNLLVFGFLCAVVVGYFVWQIQATRETFISKMKAVTELVARIIEVNARGAVLSQQTTEEILFTFLGNTARFVDYLDSVEPFNTKELTEFAKEVRLSGISILRADTTQVQGPDNWYTEPAPALEPVPRLNYDKNQHLYIFSWPSTKKRGLVSTFRTRSSYEILQRMLIPDPGIGGLPLILSGSL